MSKANQTLKDAIAEAKTLRETALANAKAALEEAFTPQLQSMLAAKLNELEEEEIEEEVVAEEEAEETLDLEALLAEESEETVEESKEEVTEEVVAEAEEEEAGEEEEEAGEEEEEEEEGEEAGEEEKDITEMTPEEVEDYIRQIAAEEFEKLEAEQGEELPGEEEAGEEMADMEDMGDEEIELEEEEVNEEVVAEEETIEENEDEINIDELLAEFGIEDEVNEEETIEEEEEVEEAYDSKKMKKMEEELALALSTIEELRSTLQETNLLNAKLLYMNKTFKGHNLTESQKVEIVKTFDKAESAKEAKLIYESLSTTLTKKEEKSPIKENLGFASKASGIVEGVKANKVIDADAQVSRWEKLAGLR